MGWYIALACAGAVDPMGGMQVVNTMGTLMQVHMIGGQLIYPFLDDNWQEIPGRRDNLLSEVITIHSRPDHDLGLSIDLGGMLVLAGNEAGLTAFKDQSQLYRGVSRCAYKIMQVFIPICKDLFPNLALTRFQSSYLSNRPSRSLMVVVQFGIPTRQILARYITTR